MGVPAERPGRTLQADIAERVLTLSPSFAVIVDALGKITWSGGAVEEITGFVPRDIVGTNMVDYIDPEWNPLALDSVAYAMAHSGIRRPMLFRLRHKDGSSFIAEVTANSQLDDPQIAGLVAFVRRWDTRYLMDQVLERLAAGAEVDEIFTLLVEVAGAEILEATSAIVWDPTGGGFANQVRSPLLGFEVDPHIEGSPFRDAVQSGRPTWSRLGATPSDVMASAKGYQWVWCWPALVGDVVGGCLVSWRRTDEEPDFTCTMLLDSLVRIMRLVLEREVNVRHLRSQEVLASLGTLTAGVAHEISGPLSFVQTFTGAAQETVTDLMEELGRSGALKPAVIDLVDDLVESLDLVEKHAYRIETIAANMLGYSQGRSTTPREVDVSNLVRTFADLGYEGYRAAGHKDFTANFVVSAPDRVMAAVYPEEIGRVVVQLVSTACAAADAARDHDTPPQLAVTLTDEEDHLTLVVSDNADRHELASGSSVEQARRGLEACREIVAGLHHGSLEAAYVTSGGTVTARLPRLPAPAGDLRGDLES